MIAKRTPNRDRVIAALASSLPSIGYRKPGSDEIVVNIRGAIERENNSPLALEALLKRNRGAPFITLNINSPGGHVRPAIQIYNMVEGGLTDSAEHPGSRSSDSRWWGCSS